MFSLISRAMAATTIKIPGSGSTGDVSSGNLPVLKIFTATSGFKGIISNAINGILVLAGVIAVVYLIYGGIQYTTAGGSPEQATKGKTTIINAIIGIVIIFVAIILVRVVTGILTSGTAGVN